MNFHSNCTFVLFNEMPVYERNSVVFKEYLRSFFLLGIACLNNALKSFGMECKIFFFSPLANSGKLLYLYVAENTIHILKEYKFSPVFAERMNLD